MKSITLLCISLFLTTSILSSPPDESDRFQFVSKYTSEQVQLFLTLNFLFRNVTQNLDNKEQTMFTKYIEAKFNKKCSSKFSTLLSGYNLYYNETEELRISKRSCLEIFFYCSDKINNYILDTNNTKQDLLLTESKQFCENEILNLPSNIDKIIVSESNFIDIPLCEWDKWLNLYDLSGAENYLNQNYFDFFDINNVNITSTPSYITSKGFNVLLKLLFPEFSYLEQSLKDKIFRLLKIFLNFLNFGYKFDSNIYSFKSNVKLFLRFLVNTALFVNKAPYFKGLSDDDALIFIVVNDYSISDDMLNSIENSEFTNLFKAYMDKEYGFLSMGLKDAMLDDFKHDIFLAKDFINENLKAIKQDNMYIDSYSSCLRNSIDFMALKESLISKTEVQNITTNNSTLSNTTGITNHIMSNINLPVTTANVTDFNNTLIDSSNNSANLKGSMYPTNIIPNKTEDIINNNTISNQNNQIILNNTTTTFTESIDNFTISKSHAPETHGVTSEINAGGEGSLYHNQSNNSIIIDKKFYSTPGANEQHNENTAVSIQQSNIPVLATTLNTLDKNNITSYNEFNNTLINALNITANLEDIDINKSISLKDTDKVTNSSITALSTQISSKNNSIYNELGINNTNQTEDMVNPSFDVSSNKTISSEVIDHNYNYTTHYETTNLNKTDLLALNNTVNSYKDTQDKVDEVKLNNDSNIVSTNKSDIFYNSNLTANENNSSITNSTLVQQDNTLSISKPNDDVNLNKTISTELTNPTSNEPDMTNLIVSNKTNNKDMKTFLNPDSLYESSQSDNTAENNTDGETDEQSDTEFPVFNRILYNLTLLALSLFYYTVLFCQVGLYIVLFKFLFDTCTLYFIENSYKIDWINYHNLFISLIVSFLFNLFIALMLYSDYIAIGVSFY
jgi:hypothetical protein